MDRILYWEGFSFFLFLSFKVSYTCAGICHAFVSWLIVVVFFFLFFFGINYLEMERGNRLSQSTLSVFIHRVLLNLPRIYIYVDESLCEK